MKRYGITSVLEVNFNLGASKIKLEEAFPTFPIYIESVRGGLSVAMVSILNCTPSSPFPALGDL